MSVVRTLSAMISSTMALVALLVLLLVVGAILIFRDEIRLVTEDVKDLDHFDPKQFPSIGLEEDQKDELYTLFKKFHTAMHDAAIPYFSVAGTALGVARHSAIIPWDDDGDVGIMQDDVEHFKKVINAHPDLKLHEAEGFGFHVSDRLTKKERFPSTDVFIFEKTELKNKKPVYRYVREYAKKQWPREYFEEDELFPLEERAFGNTSISTPNKIEKYLDRAFPKWDEWGYLPTSSHRDSTYIGKWRVRIDRASHDQSEHHETSSAKRNELSA